MILLFMLIKCNVLNDWDCWFLVCLDLIELIKVKLFEVLFYDFYVIDFILI